MTNDKDDLHSHLPVPESQQRTPLEPSRHGLPAPERYDTTAAPLRPYVEMLKRRKWVILIVLIVCFGATVLYTLLSPRIYESSTTLLVSEIDTKSAQSLASQLGLPPMMEAMTAPTLETHVALIQGEATAFETAKWLREHEGSAVSDKQITSSIRATVVPKTQLVRLSARAREPRAAQQIADAAAQTYARMNRRRAQFSSESAGVYLAEQLDIAKQKLTDAENALRAFKEQTGAVAEDASAANLLNRAALLRQDYDKTIADLAQIHSRLAKTRSQLAQQNRSIASTHVRDNTIIQQLRARLVDLEGQRLSIQSRYTSGFSEPLEQIQEQIQSTRKQLDAEIKNVIRSGGGDLAMQQTLTGQLIQGEAEAAALSARRRQSQVEIRAAEQELARVPELQVKMARLRRQVEVAQNVYSDLLKRSQEVEVGKIMALGNIDIVEQATLPVLPIKPRVALNLLLGLVLGVSIGVGIASLLDQLDDTLHSEDDVTRYVQAPVLAIIPNFRKTKFATPMQLTESTPSPGVDSYRALRFSLDYVTPGKGGRTVLITSVNSQEGKTTTVLNLAAAAAASGRTTILIGADLRKPSLDSLIQRNHDRGLSDFILGQATIDDILQTNGDARLSFICAGTHTLHPTDLLESTAMRECIAQLRQRADLIIFDSPPLLPFADGLVLATMSDTILLVSSPGRSQSRALKRARTLLGHIGRTFDGVVLNKVEEKHGYGDYYGYYSANAQSRASKWNPFSHLGRK